MSKMTYILFILAVLLGLMMRKSKICTVYIFTVMVVLAAFNYQNADFVNYQASYSTALQTKSFRYVGYSGLLKFSTNIGLSWLQYRVVFYIFVFIILVCAIKMLTKNVNIVLALYLVTYYGMDVVQMKSHIADTIAFFAISYVIKYIAKDEQLRNWRIILAMALLVLSSFLHFSAVFYIPAFLVFIILYRRKNMTKKMIAIAGVALVAVYGGIITIVTQYANKLGLLGDMSYLEGWLHRNTGLGYLLSVAFIAAAILSCNLNNRNENALILVSLDSRQRINILLSRFMLTLLMLVPLLIVNSQFGRLIRVYILILLSYYANKQIRFRASSVRFIAMILSLLITIGFSIYDSSYSFYDTTLGAILKYNSLL